MWGCTPPQTPSPAAGATTLSCLCSGPHGSQSSLQGREGRTSGTQCKYTAPRRPRRQPPGWQNRSGLDCSTGCLLHRYGAITGGAWGTPLRRHMCSLCSCLFALSWPLLRLYHVQRELSTMSPWLGGPFLPHCTRPCSRCSAGLAKDPNTHERDRKEWEREAPWQAPQLFV